MMFDDLIPDADLAGDQPGDKILRAGGGFTASAKQSAGSLIKGVGRFGADFIPGISKDNPVSRYGQDVIDANPTAIHSLSDIADQPVTAAKEAVGNAGASMAGIVGARLLGQGITAAAPLAGPAAPIVAGVGQGISLLGPYAVAALPSFGSIREQQGADDSIGAKAAAAAGAATVGVIENKFGPQEWALSALTKGGRDQLAEKFAAKTLAGSIAKGVGTGAAVEGGEELVQNPVEQLAAFQNPTTRESLADTAFSGAMGAIGGGIVGGPMAGLSHRQPQPAVVPRADGQGEVAIDPTVGPLSEAAADHVHRGDAQAAEATTGDLFGDLTPAPLASAIEPLVDVPETADPFADHEPTQFQSWQQEAEPVSLEEAQAIVRQAQDAGFDGHAVIQHGDGFSVVPREWLSADQVQAAEAFQPKAPATVDPLTPRIQAVLDAYDEAGHPDNGKIIRAALKGRMPTEEGVAFWEKQLEKNRRTWQTIAGQAQPVQPKLRTAPDLWEGDRELAASKFVPDQVTQAVLAKSNALVQQLAERGVHVDEVDSRFPADVTSIKAQESGLRGLFLRYTKQLEAKAKGYKRFNETALAKTQAELFKEIGLTVDQAASQANTTPSEAQIAAGNYQKGHVKVGPLDIAIENPAGSTRTGPGWTTKMQDHYGYMKRTEGADGDQVDVYVKAGTPADHAGPVFVIDQYNPKTGRFDEHKSFVGYRFQGAAIKAYDAHFSDGSGPTRRKGVVKMTVEQFNDWAKNGNTKSPAATPRGWEGFAAGDKVTTKAGTTGTLHFDKTQTVAYVTPDKLEGGIANPDAGKATAKAKGVFSVAPAEVSKAKTESNVYAVIEPDKVSGDMPIGTENAIPQTDRKALPRKGKAAPGRAGASSRVIAVRQAPDVQGIYHVTTQLVTVGERSLPVDRVQSWQDAANVFGNLSRYAVEHFDALVTDKAGKPLAIIGGFKGAPTMASVYPGTVMMELSRIDGAAHIWMGHNHPSGTPDLSNADRMLSGSFASILRGSNVEYHGLAAVARTGNTIAWTSTENDNGTVSIDQPAKFKVPMVEREITESNPGAAVSSPATAKSLVSGIAKDQPGVVFLTAQNGIAAFVPFDSAEMGELRSGDRLMRLFRAASKAGATGAFVAMPDGKVTAQQFANLKGALGTIDVKVLDGIQYASDGTGKGESLAERGLDSTAGHDFLSELDRDQRATPAQAEFDGMLFAAIQYGAGLDSVLNFIGQRSASPFNRELAKMLQSQGLQTTLETTDGHAEAAGSYNPERDLVLLHSQENAERVILHELMHAATIKALTNKSVASGSMRALLKQVRKEIDGHYGLKTVYEFVAEAFTNPEFQQALKGIKVSTSIRGKLSDAWQRFVSTVRQLLGLDTQDETALSRAIELGVRLIEENKTATFQHPLGILNSETTDPDKLSVRDWISHHLANQRSWALGALTRDQLADIYGKQMPEVADFDRVVQAMDQSRNIIAEKADAIIERWRKLPAKTADTLAGIMHSATLEQFDPDIKTDVQTPEQSILLKDWAELSPEAQQLYRDVRDQYAATLAKLRNGLSKRAERAGAAGQRIAAEIRLQFDKYLAEGPYFPLARFGDFILIADKHEERIVEAFESSAAREKRARQLRVTGWTTKLTAKKAYSATKDGPAGEFVGDVLKLVDGLEIEAKEKASLMDSLNQLAISALPDQSYRRHFTHRKGTSGFSSDAMRAFASSMQHVGHHVARVLHGDELTLLIDSMNKRISETTGDVDTTVQQQVANELSKRLDLMMNPTTHPVTAALGQVGFVMSLGGSVASGLTNLSQTPLVTFPHLGAKFGFDKAAGALTKASKDYFGGKWDRWSGFVLKDNQVLSADERRALTELEDAGLINLTQAHDLAGTANTDSASSRRAFAINRAMKIVGWTFHVPEVMNRQVSALAAYRLGRDKGQDHTAAVETARETLRRTHFDYSASNRSRWMAGNFTRVVTMFKQYSQNVTYLLWRQTYQALKGESPEVRREARRMLLGVAVTHFAAAGALGLPLGVFGITPLLGLLAMGMGSEDEPWDWQVEFRKMLADTFGKAGGEAIAHGPLRMLTNVDFASRVGLGDLWVRQPQGDKDGRDLVEAWMLTLLGPVAGYVGNLGTAAKAFDEGKVGRGLESMLPKMLAAPLKAARYESEGVRSWRGDDLGVALTGGDILGTALGFNPTRVSEMHEGQRAIKNREGALVGRREEIMNMFNAATMAGDSEMQAEALAAAAKFSMANPSMAINGMALRHSLQTKLRNQAQIRDGVYLAKRRQDLRAEGRFANVE